ncbi:MAG: flagellar FlbD family protein [Bacteroidota bacterium]
MIKVTRLSGSEFYINPDLIETVEATPDTVVRLTTGQNYVVQEAADTVVERFVEFKRATRGWPEKGAS